MAHIPQVRPRPPPCGRRSKDASFMAGIGESMDRWVGERGEGPRDSTLPTGQAGSVDVPPHCGFMNGTGDVRVKKG